MFIAGVIIGGIVSAEDDQMKFVCGAAAVGATAGFTVAGLGTAALVLEESSKYGAMIGTFCGGPGAGTVAGACVGGLVGGIFAMGTAAMVKYK